MRVPVLARCAATAVTVFAAAAGPAPVQAAISIARIADTSTLVPDENGDPDGSGPFTAFSQTPAQEAGRSVFYAEYTGGAGIYTNSTGKLTRVVNNGTPIPGRNVPFQSFGISPSISEGVVAFYGQGPSSLCPAELVRGIYTWAAGGILTVADDQTPVPEGGGNFITFGTFPENKGLAGGTATGKSAIVAFIGRWREDCEVCPPPPHVSCGCSLHSCDHGIYVQDEGYLKKVADTRTNIPDATGTFRDLHGVGMSNGRIVFYGEGDNGHRGLYVWTRGILQKIIDSRTPRPGEFGTFSDITRSVSLDGDQIGFVSDGGVYVASLYGQIRRIADLATPIPGEAGNFTGFGGNVPISAKRAAFVGLGSSQQGIFYFLEDELATILSTADTALNSGSSSNPFPDRRRPEAFGVRIHSFDRDQLAFWTRFHDGSSGIFMASGIPLSIVRSPVSMLSRYQRSRIAGAGAFQELIFNYSTQALSVTPYTIAPGHAYYSLPSVNEWMGVFHYDYGSARFSGLHLLTWDILER